jgi:hypothetical protein
MDGSSSSAQCVSEGYGRLHVPLLDLRVGVSTIHPREMQHRILSGDDRPEPVRVSKIFPTEPGRFDAV